MSDPIDRGALMRKFTTFVKAHGDSEPAPTWNDAVSLVVSMPSTQPERKRGKWIRYDGYWLKTMYKCSECGAMIEINGKYNINFFCYHCGADMRERSDDDLE